MSLLGIYAKEKSSESKPAFGQSQTSFAIENNELAPYADLKERKVPKSESIVATPHISEAISMGL